MIKKTILSSVIASILVISSLNANASDDEQIMALQRSLLSMQNQVTQLQNQLAESQGQIESLNHDIEILQKENSTLKAQLQNQVPVQGNENVDSNSENTLTSTTGGDSTATIKPSANKATVSVNPNNVSANSSVPSEAVKLYNASYNLVLQQKLSEAEKGFIKFVETYKDDKENSLTPNAWYWLGQAQYKQKKLDDARVSFLHTAKYTKSNKRADALYKLGLISKAKGDKDKAVKFFNVLLKNYPGSSSAVLAQKELNSLK